MFHLSYIYIKYIQNSKFNILVEVKSNSGKEIFLGDNVFLKYEDLIKINKSHINKLLTKEKFREFQKILKVIYWYDNDINYREPENKRAAEIMNKLKKG